MDPELQQINMWRRRLAETEAGLTAYVAARGDAEALEALLPIKAAFLRALPADDFNPSAWQRAFFTAQAAMERFVVRRFGHQGVAEFARHVGKIYGKVSYSGQGGAGEIMERIERQAASYRSEVELGPVSDTHGVLEIQHCAIWDYRERARDSGMELVLDSPCQYCTHLLSSMIASARLRACHSLRSAPDDPGCRWEAKEAGDGQEDLAWPETVRLMEDDVARLPMIQVRTLVAAADLDLTVRFYEELLGQPCNLRFSYAERELEVAAVGPVLVIAGSETALAPVRDADATLLVPSLDAYLARATEIGGRVVEQPKVVPSGRNARVRHPDGLLVEYVEHLGE